MMNVYDFDGTIYKGDSSVDFFLFALRRNPFLVRYIPTQVKGFLLYQIKQIGKTKFKEHFFSFLAGVDAEKLVVDFWAHNYCKIYKWYIDQKQEDDVVISASPEFLLKPICKRLGVHKLIASRVDCRTGKFLGENCRGEEKVRRFGLECQAKHIDCFYSDSYSDWPLAQCADNAFMVTKGNITKWDK